MWWLSIVFCRGTRGYYTHLLSIGCTIFSDLRNERCRTRRVCRQYPWGDSRCMCLVVLELRTRSWATVIDDFTDCIHLDPRSTHTKIMFCPRVLVHFPFLGGIWGHRFTPDLMYHDVPSPGEPPIASTWPAVQLSRQTSWLWPIVLQGQRRPREDHRHLHRSGTENCWAVGGVQREDRCVCVCLFFVCSGWFWRS